MIRLLEDKDYQDYVELINQLSKIGEITQHDFEFFVFTQHLLPSTYRFFVYELDGKVVGCLTILLENKLARKSLHIEDVVTHSDFRGKGIASELIEHAKNYAIDNNCYKIILDCSSENVAFYNKVGFKETGVQMSIRL